jgi:hypothetical protein
MNKLLEKVGISPEEVGRHGVKPSQPGPSSLTQAGTARKQNWWPGHPLYTREEARERRRATQRAAIARYNARRRTRMRALGLTTNGTPWKPRNGGLFTESELLDRRRPQDRGAILKAIKEVYIWRQDFANAARIRDAMKGEC